VARSAGPSVFVKKKCKASPNCSSQAGERPFPFDAPDSDAGPRQSRYPASGQELGKGFDVADLIVPRLVAGLADAHVLDHAMTQRADDFCGLGGRSWEAPVLRLECFNPSILKPASRPVIPQRLNCSSALAQPSALRAARSRSSGSSVGLICDMPGCPRHVGEAKRTRWVLGRGKKTGGAPRCSRGARFSDSGLN
jgi:hypothetical protein